MSDKLDEIIDVQITLTDAPDPSVPTVPTRPWMLPNDHPASQELWLAWWRETARLAETYVGDVLREYIIQVGKVPATPLAENTCTGVCAGALYRMGVSQEMEAEVSFSRPQVWDGDGGTDFHVTIRPTAALAPVIEAAARREASET